MENRIKLERTETTTRLMKVDDKGRDLEVLFEIAGNVSRKRIFSDYKIYCETGQIPKMKKECLHTQTIKYDGNVDEKELVSNGFDLFENLIKTKKIQWLEISFLENDGWQGRIARNNKFLFTCTHSNLSSVFDNLEELVRDIET